jgi:cytochrome c1
VAAASLLADDLPASKARHSGQPGADEQAATAQPADGTGELPDTLEQAGADINCKSDRCLVPVPGASA